MGSHAVLEAPQLPIQLDGAHIRQGIDHPLLVTPGFDQAAPAEIGQMPGGGNLGQAQHLLEVAHAERRLYQEVDNAQPRLVAKASVDFDEAWPAHILNENIHTG
jgi:hypothetical protein